MKKTLLVLAALACLLSACGEKGKTIATADGKEAIVLKPTEYFLYMASNSMVFNGFSGKVEEGWIVSFSSNANAAVNQHFIVSEGESIVYNGVPVIVAKLSPKTNEITLKRAQ